MAHPQTCTKPHRIRLPSQFPIFPTDTGLSGIQLATGRYGHGSIITAGPPLTAAQKKKSGSWRKRQNHVAHRRLVCRAIFTFSYEPAGFRGFDDIVENPISRTVRNETRVGCFEEILVDAPAQTRIPGSEGQETTAERRLPQQNACIVVTHWCLHFLSHQLSLDRHCNGIGSGGGQSLRQSGCPDTAIDRVQTAVRGRGSRSPPCR